MTLSNDECDTKGRLKAPACTFPQWWPRFIRKPSIKGAERIKLVLTERERRLRTLILLSEILQEARITVTALREGLCQSKYVPTLIDGLRLNFLNSVVRYGTKIAQSR